MNRLLTFTRVLFGRNSLRMLSPNQISVVVSLIPKNNVQFRHNSDTTSKAPPRRRRIIENRNPDNISTSEDSGTTDRPQRFLRPTSVQDVATFTEASDAFLQTLIKALQPMELYNEVFEVTVSNPTEQWELNIHLKPGDGIYKLSIDLESNSLLFSSPISGSYTYVLCASTGEFVGEEDGHSLIGLLVRDLSRQCNGYPHF